MCYNVTTMPVSLYQKYRPQTWKDVCDQQHIKVTLQHQIERNQIAHAYLFVGPRGVGKTTLARLMAKAINCEQRKKGSGEPCNACPSCARIQAQQSFDIVEIDAASNTGVDHVREHILASAEVSAGHGTYRVFIIDEVHMLSTAAFNAMLKMLEEPPSHVIFILATTELHKVPATIISRCQRFDFKRVPADGMRKRLEILTKAEGVSVEGDVLSAIVEQADGSLRDAESILGQVLALGVKNITFDEASLVIPRSNRASAAKLVEMIAKKQTAEAITFVNTLVEEGVSVKVFIGDCIAWLRALLLLQVGDRLDAMSRDSVGELHELLQEQAQLLTTAEVTGLIDILLRRQNTLADSPLPQLPLEMAIIEATSRQVDVEVKNQ